MRKIKFRVWDVENKSWLDGCVIDQDGDLLVYTPGGHLLASNDYYIYSQYTGLKDWNGQEIWEGDVVEYHVEEEDYVKYNTSVSFREGDACWSIGSPYDIRYTLLERDLEVIGNIYENPGLILQWKDYQHL